MSLQHQFHLTARWYLRKLYLVFLVLTNSIAWKEAGCQLIPNILRRQCGFVEPGLRVNGGGTTTSKKKHIRYLGQRVEF